MGRRERTTGQLVDTAHTRRIHLRQNSCPHPRSECGLENRLRQMGHTSPDSGSGHGSSSTIASVVVLRAGWDDATRASAGTIVPEASASAPAFAP